MVKKKHSNDIMSAREVLERMAEIEGFSPFEFYSNGKPDINKILYKRKSNRIKTVTIIFPQSNCLPAIARIETTIESLTNFDAKTKKRCQ